MNSRSRRPIRTCCGARSSAWSPRLMRSSCGRRDVRRAMAWPFSALGNDSFGPGVTEGGCQRSFRLPVGNEAVDIRPMREYRQRALVEFGMVGDDDGFRRPLHHRAIDGSGFVIGIIDAAGADTSRAYDRAVGFITIDAGNRLRAEHIAFRRV